MGKAASAAQLKKHYQAIGRKGGKARAASMKPQDRASAAKAAAEARWGTKPEIAAPSASNDSET